MYKENELFEIKILRQLCELIMCSDPWPCSEASEQWLKHYADMLAVKCGYGDWIDAYHKIDINNSMSMEDEIDEINDHFTPSPRDEKEREAGRLC